MLTDTHNVNHPDKSDINHAEHKHESKHESGNEAGIDDVKQNDRKNDKHESHNVAEEVAHEQLACIREVFSNPLFVQKADRKEQEAKHHDYKNDNPRNHVDNDNQPVRRRSKSVVHMEQSEKRRREENRKRQKRQSALADTVAERLKYSELTGPVRIPDYRKSAAETYGSNRNSEEKPQIHFCGNFKSALLQIRLNAEPRHDAEAKGTWIRQVWRKRGKLTACKEDNHDSRSEEQNHQNVEKQKPEHCWRIKMFKESPAAGLVFDFGNLLTSFTRDDEVVELFVVFNVRGHKPPI